MEDIVYEGLFTYHTVMDFRDGGPAFSLITKRHTFRSDALYRKLASCLLLRQVGGYRCRILYGWF